MSADRELLELAAKAAGVSGAYQRTHQPYGDAWVDGIDTGAQFFWNPLADDGDSLRLSNELKMTIAWEPMRGGWSVGAVTSAKFAWLTFDENQKRAIVRAAAKIGAAE